MRDKRREQEEYREMQERKKRMEERRARRKSYQSYELKGSSDSEAHSSTGKMSPARARVERRKREQEELELLGRERNSGSVKNSRGSRESRSLRELPPEKLSRKEKKALKAEGYGSNKMGKILGNIQLLVTIIFVAILFFVDVLPYAYSGIISAVVLLIAVLVKRNQGKRNKRHGLGKCISILITIFLLIMSFYLVRGYLILKDMGGQNDSTINLDRDTYSVYISGIDVYGEVTEQSRSDVNLIATVNPKTHQVLLTTTPRDYYVEIPEVSKGEKDKLTHAGIYGIDTSMATLEQLYNEKIDFYIRVNFTSVIDIVNALGGVTVDSTEAFTTGQDAGCIVDIQKGKNKLNGEQALAFARERHALEDGDNQRGKNQQILLEGLYKAMLTPATIVNMNGVLSSIDGNVETNMTTGQLQSFSKGVLGGGTSMNIYSMAAEGTSERRYCYSYPGKSLYVCVPIQDSVDQIRQMMENVSGGQALPEKDS